MKYINTPKKVETQLAKTLRIGLSIFFITYFFYVVMNFIVAYKHVSLLQ